MERLRDIARAGGTEHGVLAQEAAAALAALGSDASGVVLACKRLVGRHPSAGPVWSMCARVLAAADARQEAWRCLTELDEDPTAGHLATLLPDDATVAVLGWPEVAARALPPRGDLAVLVVDALGEGGQLVRRLGRLDVDATEVPECGAGTAAVSSDVVLLEAVATGPSSFLAIPGSRAVAAVAAHAGVPVWLVAGAGRALPGPVWDVAMARSTSGPRPWDADVEELPLDLVDVVVGPGGKGTATELACRADCPVAPELLAAERQVPAGAGPFDVAAR